MDLYDNHTQAMGRTGSAIVIVLLVMVALTVLGLLSIHCSLIELQIAHNSKEGRKNFYLAESAALEGIQRIADMTPIDLEDKPSFWHHSKSHVEQNDTDFRDSREWKIEADEENNALGSRLHQTAFISAVEWRLATGSSAIVTGTRLYMNRIYGLCNRHNHPIIVELGYCTRY